MKKSRNNKFLSEVFASILVLIIFTATAIYSSYNINYINTHNNIKKITITIDEVTKKDEGKNDYYIITTTNNLEYYVSVKDVIDITSFLTKNDEVVIYVYLSDYKVKTDKIYIQGMEFNDYIIINLDNNLFKKVLLHMCLLVGLTIGASLAIMYLVQNLFSIKIQKSNLDIDTKKVESLFNYVDERTYLYLEKKKYKRNRIIYYSAFLVVAVIFSVLSIINFLFIIVSVLVIITELTFVLIFLFSKKQKEKYQSLYCKNYLEYLNSDYYYVNEKKIKFDFPLCFKENIIEFNSNFYIDLEKNIMFDICEGDGATIEYRHKIKNLKMKPDTIITSKPYVYAVIIIKISYDIYFQDADLTYDEEAFGEEDIFILTNKMYQELQNNKYINLDIKNEVKNLEDKIKGKNII